MAFTADTCSGQVLGEDLTGSYRDFRHQAALHRAREDGVELHAGAEPYLRSTAAYGMRATQRLQHGTHLLRVPNAVWHRHSAQRAVELLSETCPDVKQGLTALESQLASNTGKEQAKDLIGVGVLSTMLVAAARGDTPAPAGPYVDTLPRVREAESPMVWHPMELGELAGCHALETVASTHETCAMLHGALFGPQGPLAQAGDLPFVAPTLHEMVWAVATINRHAGYVPDRHYRGTMVPLLHLFRGDLDPSCGVMVDASRDADAAARGERDFVVFAARDVEEGEELTLPLPPTPSFAAFGVYGTLPSAANPHDVAFAEAHLPPAFGLRDARRRLGEADDMLPTLDGHPPAVTPTNAWSVDVNALEDEDDRALALRYRLLDRYQQQYVQRFPVPASGELPEEFVTVLRILVLDGDDAARLDPDAPELDAALSDAHGDRVRAAAEHSLRRRFAAYPTTIQVRGEAQRTPPPFFNTCADALVAMPQDDKRILAMLTSMDGLPPMPRTPEVPESIYDSFQPIQLDRMRAAVRMRIAEKTLLEKALREVSRRKAW